MAHALADNVLWRWNGPASAETFHAMLNQVGADHIAVVGPDRVVAGHAALYGINPTHRTAFFEASLVSAVTGSRDRSVGAIAAGLSYLLGRHDLHKLYLETTDRRLSQFRSLIGTGLFSIEGRFREHVSVGGRREDAVILGASGADVRRYVDQRWSRRIIMKAGHH